MVVGEQIGNRAGGDVEVMDVDSNKVLSLSGWSFLPRESGAAVSWDWARERGEVPSLVWREMEINTISYTLKCYSQKDRDDREPKLVRV